MREILIMLAGSTASALSAACSTPFDVVKTRVSLGTISPNVPVIHALGDILKNEGLRGLYAGTTTTLGESDEYVSIAPTLVLLL